VYLSRLVLFLSLGALPAFLPAQNSVPLLLTVADTVTANDEQQLVAALHRAGYHCVPTPDPSGNGTFRVQVGPFLSQEQMEAARSRLTAAGYKLPTPDAPASGGLTPAQTSLEARAIANLGGSKSSGPPVTGSDLEAQALANLGGGAPSGPPATGADLEAQALAAMKANTEEAERQHQIALRKEQEEREEQARIERERAEEAAANASASQSGSIGTRTSSILDAITGVLSQANDQMDAHLAQQDARNAQLQRQADALVTSNNARREREAEEQREQAEQRRQAAAQQSTSNTSRTNSRLCNSAQSSESLIAQGCAGSTSTSSTAANSNMRISANTSSQSSLSDRSNQNNGSFVTTSTGTAPPANCVYLSDAQPCVPLAQYAQMQAAQKAANGQGICPASGFVPGVMLRVESDVAEPVPCKPGTPYGPLIATTASGGFTGVTPPDPGSADGSSGNSGSSGGGEGGSSAGGSYDPALNSCVVYFYKKDPITGDNLVLQNNCSISARISFYAGPQVYGAVTLASGGVDNTYQSRNAVNAAGPLYIYACPANDIARKTDGTQASMGPNNRFVCSRQ
jgi:hypothetical protein